MFFLTLSVWSRFFQPIAFRKQTYLSGEQNDTSFGPQGQFLTFGANGVDLSFTDDRNGEFPKTSLLKKWEDEGQNPLHPSSVQDKSDKRFFKECNISDKCFYSLSDTIKGAVVA